ncbi:hypothetical protein KAFR_0K00820 [Kazachstania africana CBS 2517]|uniref:DNA topoisomerase (ATP-hydrolyzing) n=1 Tax=Kazachstania africana (strain ATCC 22294 / BCRC 22015 / CBS 2517 / CECT 1963 / NBRC 1671 / NRRL Y-8276) TaxID=1071382 RepID=H2B1D7_KAZAF|nr:hypothetical protein KAFR_0K00820 [Kazachstania africana CBS 2517]CCF60437.1 hypothetical protein KAFR_0K00820 [Kazachstania africana CBS 2517]
MTISLSNLLKDNPTKRCLIETLTPKKRSVHIDLENSITDIFNLISNCLQINNEPVDIVFKTGKMKNTLSFPVYGKASRSHNSNTVLILLTLLKIINERATTNTTSTIRDVYYSNVPLFKTQRTVNYYVNIIRLNFPGMNSVIPAQKGLVYTSATMEIYHADGSKMMLMGGTSSLIPYLYETSTIACAVADFDKIIILEKEAVYSKLVQNKLMLNSLIITGKGYPDHLTRKFINKVSHLCSDIEIFVDADPDGICIALNYMKDCPMAQYKGITVAALINTKDEDNLMKLTPRDSTISRNLLVKLQRLTSHQKGLPGIKLALQRHLFFGVKGEMNSMLLR